MPARLATKTLGFTVAAVLTPVLLWVLLTVRPHDGRVGRIEDYLLLIASDGWQAMTVAVMAAIGPLFASVIGTLLGVEASARPRQVGDLTYLAAAGDRRYRIVLATRFASALGRTALWTSLLLVSSAAVGWLAFGTGQFETIDGEAIEAAEALRIVAHSALAIYCVGAVCCATVITLGVRTSIQTAAAGGMCLYFLELATGSMPIVGKILRMLPLGNYHGWTNRLAEDLSRGSSAALYLTTAIWLVAAAALATWRGFAALPRVGGAG